MSNETIVYSVAIQWSCFDQLYACFAADLSDGI